MDSIYQLQQETHEKDFLAAYQGQMYHIKQEIEKLKHQLTEGEMKIKRDKRVADLNSQVGWFKSEALHLKNDLVVKKQNANEFKAENLGLVEEKVAMEKALNQNIIKVKRVQEALKKSEE